MIEVTYEVYRYKKWWKNKFKIIVPSTFGFKGPIYQKKFLSKEAYRRDLGEIRNIDFKHIINEK